MNEHQAWGLSDKQQSRQASWVFSNLKEPANLPSSVFSTCEIMKIDPPPTHTKYKFYGPNISTTKKLMTQKGKFYNHGHLNSYDMKGLLPQTSS